MTRQQIIEALADNSTPTTYHIEGDRQLLYTMNEHQVDALIDALLSLE